MLGLVRRVVIPFYDLLTGCPTRKYMAELEKSQWFSRGQLRKIQEKKLRHLIKHAYETVPYYHGMFRKSKLNPSDIKSLDDLAKLPILTREEVREGHSARTLISRIYEQKKLLNNRRFTAHSSTGGSTGEPIRFYTTIENRNWSMAARHLAWRWAGFELGDKYAQFFGSPLDQEVFASVRGKIEARIKRGLSFNSYRWSPVDMERFALMIAKSKPKMIYGNAVPVALMARFIEERDIRGVEAKCVIIDSNMLFKREVETIERVFHCRVWWNYHNRENGTFASECSIHSGYHLFIQNFIVEFVQEGDVVSPGEAGNIVVTDLYNYAMPFVRYEVGDVGSYSDETCTCGRGLPLMADLQGRRCDILVTEKGGLVHGPFYQFERFFDVAKMKQYQIIQENRRYIVVKIIPDEGFSDRDVERIRTVVHFVMGENMEVDVKIVDSIRPSKSGKRRTVVRRFTIDFDP